MTTKQIDRSLLALVVAGIAARIIGLFHFGFTFDEAFTAMTAREPLSSIGHRLALTDSHPPLDYFLRHFLAVHGVQNWLFRLPSLVLGIASLVVFAKWMRTKGVAGVVATFVFSLSTYGIYYGVAARMYAAMLLVGVLIAWAADSWLRQQRTRWALIAGGALTAGLFLNAGAVLVAPSVVLFPGLRRDRASWIWRSVTAFAGVLYAALWLGAFREQARHASNSWVPFTTPAHVVSVLGEMVTYNAGAKLPLVFCVIIAVAIVAKSDAVLCRVFVWLGVAPFVLGALLGVRFHLMLPRTFAAVSWMPALGVGLVVAWVLSVQRAAAVALCALLFLCVTDSTVQALRETSGDDGGSAMAYVRARTKPGDAVGIFPFWLGPELEWTNAVHRPGPEYELDGTRFKEPVTAFTVDSKHWNGNMWLIEPSVYGAQLGPTHPCGATRLIDGHRIRCLHFAASRRLRR